MSPNKPPVLVVPEVSFTKYAYLYVENTPKPIYGVFAWLLYRLGYTQDQFNSMSFNTVNMVVSEFYALDNDDIKILFFASINLEYDKIRDYICKHATDPLKEVI